MANKIPFDEDMMTLIMGVGGPETPGQHGRTNAPMPTKDALSVMMEIRDLCDEFIEKCGKDPDEDERPMKKGKPDDDRPDFNDADEEKE